MDEDKPFFDQIGDAHHDCETLKAAVSKYKISDQDKCYDLQNNLTYDKIQQIYKEIDSTLDQNWTTNYVVL